MPSRSQSSGSQAPDLMSSSIVREALERSVTCSPQSLWTSQESIVPNRARSAPSTLRSSHSIFVPEKYGSMTSPVRSRTMSVWPASTSSLHRAAVRRSCQTSAWWIGSPVSGSQPTTVSRWFVIPIALRSLPSMRASASASAPTWRVTSQISAASCSTHPGFGKYWANSE